MEDGYGRRWLGMGSTDEEKEEKEEEGGRERQIK